METNTLEKQIMLFAKHSMKAITRLQNDVGSPLVQSLPTNKDDQLWEIIPVGEDLFFLKANNNKYAAVNTYGKITLETQESVASKQQLKWKLKSSNNLLWQIASAFSGKFLEVPDFAQCNGARINQQNWYGGYNQYWYMVHNPAIILISATIETNQTHEPDTSSGRPPRDREPLLNALVQQPGKNYYVISSNLAKPIDEQTFQEYENICPVVDIPSDKLEVSKEEQIKALQKLIENNSPNESPTLHKTVLEAFVGNVLEKIPEIVTKGTVLENVGKIATKALGYAGIAIDLLSSTKIEGDYPPPYRGPYRPEYPVLVEPEQMPTGGTGVGSGGGDNTQGGDPLGGGGG